MVRPFTNDGAENPDNTSGIIEYHIFTDGDDYRAADFEEAKQCYVRMLKQNRRRARLYAEYFASWDDHAKDNLCGEDCLRAYGGYPL